MLQVARKPPLARKRVITAKLVTPVQTQDAGALTSGEAVAETQAPTPKAPSKSITPIDQDVLQVICSLCPSIPNSPLPNFVVKSTEHYPLINMLTPFYPIGSVITQRTLLS
jgi:hypothetical protein